MKIKKHFQYAFVLLVLNIFETTEKISGSLLNEDQQPMLTITIGKYIHSNN
ncbi:hypothetical protein [Hydrotalea flava]|uniref:hypothetical protein n=1 Tax=Hydrotalea flava TaxID=714549 RepID=UPI00142EA590|nr:hypothetical protein [Hydrotalea flava]